MSQPQSEEAAYNLAKRKINTIGFGRLKAKEIDEIVEEPPVVDFRTYMRLRSLNLDQLLQIQSVLAKIIPHINREDVFFYLTRGYSPNYPHLRSQINDYYKYENLDSVNQTLIDQMYGGKMGFINKTRKHKLEDIVMEYDKIMGLPHKVRELAEKNKMDITQYLNEDDGFIDQIKNMI